MGTRSDVIDSTFANSGWRRGEKAEQMELVPADNYQITKEHPPVLIMTPGAAVDVLMPPANSETRNLRFFIRNQHATNVITLKDSADAAFNPAITVPGVTGRLVICTGATWRQVI